MASKSSMKDGKKKDDELAGANMAALTKLLEEQPSPLSLSGP